MQQYGFDVRVIVSPIDEPECLGDGLSPAQLAEALAHFKAKSVADTLEGGTVIGGDTVVALGSRLFGKPADRDHAGDTIKALAGTTHDVVSAVALLDAKTGRRLIRHDTTAVIMRPLTDEEVETYLDTGAWAGKAGAYGIQDYGDAFVERIEGSFTNVVGFPMELVCAMLADWGIEPAPRE